MKISSTKDLIDRLRIRRQRECFDIINRGIIWYNTLTTEQLLELERWYDDWLKCTLTLKVPKKPDFLDELSSVKLVTTDDVKMLIQNTKDMSKLLDRLSSLEEDVKKLKSIVNDPLDFD